MQRLLPQQITTPRRPAGWVMPAYNTPEFWRAWADGLISDAEGEAASQAFQIRSDRARAALRVGAPAPARWSRPAPRASNQYAGPTATTAARDRRLVAGAVRCLAIVRAFCGRRGGCTTMKAVLARELSVSKRTVQRYIRDLVRFGYLKADPTKDAQGYFTGLAITLLDAVLPVKDHGRAWLDRWIARTTGATGSEAENRGASFREGVETALSPQKGLEIKTLLFTPRGRRETRSGYPVLT